MPDRDPGKTARLAEGIPVVPAFDGYRAYAIAGVVVLHLLVVAGVLESARGSWGYTVVQGSLGQMIDVLFVVSGFVVFLPTVARGGEFGSTRAYALRRAARLAPAYWLVLVLLLIAIAFVPRTPEVDFPTAGTIADHFAFLQAPAVLLFSQPLGFGVDAPVWTLSLEVTFYVLLPFVAAWYSRRPLVGLAIAALLTAAWHVAIGHVQPWAEALGISLSPLTALRITVGSFIQCPFFLYSFAAGMTGAWAYVRLRAAPEAGLARRARLAQVGSLAALVAFGYLIGRRADGGVLLGAEVGRQPALLSLGFTSALAVFLVAGALGWSRPFALRPVRAFADHSYGVYLVHIPIAGWAVSLLALGHTAAKGATGSDAVLATGDGSLGDLLILALVVVPLAGLFGYASARWTKCRPGAGRARAGAAPRPRCLRRLRLRSGMVLGHEPGQRRAPAVPSLR